MTGLKSDAKCAMIRTLTLHEHDRNRQSPLSFLLAPVRVIVWRQHPSRSYPAGVFYCPCPPTPLEVM